MKTAKAAKAMTPVDRRWLIKAMLAGSGTASLPLAACTQAGGAASEISAVPLDGGAHVFSGAGGNVLAADTGDGLLLVDTGHADHARALLRAISSEYDGAPLRAAFNTHWHHDHTGGNAAVRAAGATIHAHENTRLWLTGDFYVPWEDRHYTPMPEEMLPTDSFYVGGDMRIGARDVEYGLLPRAHTDGDVYVYLRDADILAVGDVVGVGAYPVMDYYTGGWIGALVDANARLLEIAGPDTRIVPGKGPVVGRDHLEAQHAMLVAVRDRLFEMVRLGWSAQEMLDAGATEGFDEEWGDPTLFVKNAYPGMWGNSYAIGRVV